MTHNQFSEEVAVEVERQRNYGGPAKARNIRGNVTESYKKQALQELASRLILEQELEEMRWEMDALRNKLEAMA